MALELLQLTEVRNYVQNSHRLKKKVIIFQFSFLMIHFLSLNYFLSCVYDLRIGEKKRSFFIPYFLFFHP